MATPSWIDQTLSDMLPVLRDRGEGQHLEFMVKYPDSGYELSREIAAFASSNAGTILIGVSDDGDLKGLPGLDTNTGRDTLLRRVEGVCSGNIRPAITPVVKFAQEGEAIILVIEVPRGSQPIYYSKHTPYMRHLSSSRPAEPHEVIERISEWLKTSPVEPAEDDPKSRFLSSIAESLVTTLMLADQVEERNMNPWLDFLQSQLKAVAGELREFAAEDIAAEINLDTPLREIADKLDRAASHVHTMGGESWNTYTGHIADARTTAQAVMAAHIDPVPLSDSSRDQIRDLLRKAVRQLGDLDSRAGDMADDARMEELQDEASRIGSLLLRLSYYRLDDVAPGLAAALRPLANELNLIETERLYMDGGQSVSRILEKWHDLAERLEALISQKDI